MRRVIVYCEGPTEETFVNQILAPAFFPKNIYLSASSCNGVSRYSIIRHGLSIWCKQDKSAVITTMLDYYGLPVDTPGMQEQIPGTIYDKVSYVENRIKEDIGADNLIPNLMLHEFEALLFSRPECFSYCGLRKSDIKALCDIRSNVETPEHINNDPNTAPSKRILSLYPKYSKIIDGFNIAQDIGLSVMRSECRHFDAWVSALEGLGNCKQN